MILDGQVEVKIRNLISEKFSDRIEKLIQVVETNKVDFSKCYKPNAIIYQIGWDLNIKCPFSDFYTGGPMIKSSRLDNFTDRDIANKIFFHMRQLNRDIEKFVKTLDGAEEYLHFNQIGVGTGITHMVAYTRDYNKENRKRRRR